MNDYTLDDVNFTEHILNRFVERTMNKSGNEVKQYLAVEEQRVKEQLLKLYNSAELLWSGKVREHNFTHFYINKDGWIIVVDKEGKKLITVYKVDLELDSDFNKTYVEKVKEKIKEMVAILSEKDEERHSLKKESEQEIKELEKDNADLKSKIDYNNDRIEHLKKGNELLEKEYKLLESDIQKKIEKFVNAKIF